MDTTVSGCYNKRMIHPDDYPFASPEDIGACALALAQSEDEAGFQSLLAGIQGHRNYMNAERAITDTLLAHDCVAMYRKSFEDGYLSNWCKSHTAHVLRHCPGVLDAWISGIAERPGKVVGLLARQLVYMPVNERLRLLRGEYETPFVGYPTDAFAQKRLHGQLSAHPHYWRELSPSWVETPDLKDAARTLGWSETQLPAMVYRNMREGNAGVWEKTLPYVYTLMACETYRYDQNFGASAPTSPERINCVKGASALDIAMAKSIFAQCPNSKKVAVHRPRSVKPLAAGELLTVEGMIQAHVMMDTLGAFALKLAHGEHPKLQAEEAFGLPDNLLAQEGPQT